MNKVIYTCTNGYVVICAIARSDAADILAASLRLVTSNRVLVENIEAFRAAGPDEKRALEYFENLS